MNNEQHMAELAWIVKELVKKLGGEVVLCAHDKDGKPNMEGGNAIYFARTEDNTHLGIKVQGIDDPPPSHIGGIKLVGLEGVMRHQLNEMKSTIKNGGNGLH